MRFSVEAALLLSALLLFPSVSVGMDARERALDIMAAVQISGLETEISAVVELEVGAETVTASGLEGLDVDVPAEQDVFGFDGAGGTYHVLDDGRILLVDSKGSAGVVALSFQDFIAIATGLPGWRSALRAIGNKDLAAARADWLALRIKWDLDRIAHSPWQYGTGYKTATPGQAASLIAKALEASRMDDPFAALHTAIHTRNDDVKVRWNGQLLALPGSDPPP